MKQNPLSLAIIILSIFFFACNNPRDQKVLGANDVLGPSQFFPSSPQIPTPPEKRTYTTDALLFAGDGTWENEIGSIEDILTSHEMSYQKVDSQELDQMSLEQLTTFGLFIFPGGNGGTQTKSLSSETHARLRSAVQDKGVSYVGFCAGAFIAVAPKPEPGKDVSYGLGIVPGPELPYYYLENELESGVAMTLETFADGTKRDLFWYGGPITLPNPGTTIAKYPNGDPAISQIWSGKGFVVLSAVHPTATQEVRDLYGIEDSDGLDFDIAWNLMEAALHQREQKTF